MTTSRQLWNEDILREIFSHLAPPTIPLAYSPDERASLAALARCARSSRALHGPALDALWRELNSLWVLLDVFSPSLPAKTEAASDEDPNLQTIPMPHAACVRFHYYARRVRRLVHNAGISKIRRNLQAYLLAELYMHSGKQPLLPNLTYLFWVQSTASDVFDVCSLVSPALRDFHISQIDFHMREGAILPDVDPGPRPDRDMVFGRFIGVLSTIAPGLETLSLNGMVPASAAACASTAFKGLRSFNIVNLAHRGFGVDHDPVLRAAAELPRLRDLSIKLTADDPPLEGDDLEGDYNGFSGLRSLCVHSSLALVPRFLAHVASSELASFDAFLPTPNRCTTFHACLDTLATRFPATLRVVRISGSWAGDLASLARPMVLLAPLLRLRQLEELAIVSRTGVGLSLAPGDVLALARAWPAIRVLKLLYQPVPAALPIDALATLAAHCPALHTLWLASVDLKGACARDLQACPVSPGRGHGLKEIWLAASVGVDVSCAAQFIDRMFPNVDTQRSTFPWHPCQDVFGWESLLRCLQQVKDARIAAAAS
ncbi:hypothetical protein C8Q73DRAFT_662441 [Cubamyces lactineus]|nr:hypothetical protein C8Q73DRAFT_662441 [Cubamyces lactineus]